MSPSAVCRSAQGRFLVRPGGDGTPAPGRFQVEMFGIYGSVVLVRPAISATGSCGRWPQWRRATFKYPFHGSSTA